jgi:hypothetical protein
MCPSSGDINRLMMMMMRSNGESLTSCYVCSVHSFILVKLGVCQESAGMLLVTPLRVLREKYLLEMG